VRLPYPIRVLALVVGYLVIAWRAEIDDRRERRRRSKQTCQ
jgi:hypothetical protein